MQKWQQSFQEDISSNAARHAAFQSSLLGSPEFDQPETIPFGNKMIDKELLVGGGLLCDLDPTFGIDWKEEKLRLQILRESRKSNTILNDIPKEPSPDWKKKELPKPDLSKFGNATLKSMILFAGPKISRYAKEELESRP
jgi:hypothetical protein